MAPPTREEQFIHEGNRAFDRALLIGLVSFFVVVTAVVFFPFPPYSAPYFVFGLGTVATILANILIYYIRTLPARAAALAAALSEETIRTSRDLFTEVYQRSPVPYLLIAEDGKITSANTAAVRLFKEQEEALAGQSIWSRLRSRHPDHLAIVEERFTHGVALAAEEFEVPHPDGTSAWVLVSLFHFIDASQRRLGLMTLVDITKQKEIDTAKSEFVSLASHQLRTPIAGMRWNTELLMYDTGYPLPPEQRAKAERLMVSVDRLSVLVDNFLSVSRFELGALLANPVATDMCLFFDEVFSAQQLAVREKGLLLEVPSPGTYPERLIVDGRLLEMIITNFLTNAIKYTPAGGTIKVGVRRDNDTLAVTVADNGIGIPVAEQRRLFSKMFRASNAEKLVTDGTGLGLYIAKRAAEVLGGNVSFTSGEGVGSAFTVTVPIDTVL